MYQGTQRYFQGLLNTTSYIHKDPCGRSVRYSPWLSGEGITRGGKHCQAANHPGSSDPGGGSGREEKRGSTWG